MQFLSNTFNNFIQINSATYLKLSQILSSQGFKDRKMNSHFTSHSLFYCKTMLDEVARYKHAFILIWKANPRTKTYLSYHVQQQCCYNSLSCAMLEKPGKFYFLSVRKFGTYFLILNLLVIIFECDDIYTINLFFINLFLIILLFQ